MSAPSDAPRILVVDDDPSIGSLLLHGLTPEGYIVDVIQDGLHALDHVRQQLPDLILLDIDLPGISGDEVCRQLKSEPATQFIPIVMITGGGAYTRKVEAWDYGADEFLTKPFYLVEVIARCRSLLRIKRLIEERDSAEAVVFALARAVEAKSQFTHGHSERVTGYALMLADALGITGSQREVLRKGSLLHDVGKISIPDDILNKPGRLSEEEFAAIRRHPVTGAHIVEPLVSMREAVPLIRWHHERLDGKGYPDGLRGEQIPLMVRVLSVCDVYDSLASDRPYRAGMPHARCLEILREEAWGGGLDGELVQLFESLLPQVDEPHERLKMQFESEESALAFMTQDSA
jgi:putative two-component system response regulator